MSPSALLMLHSNRMYVLHYYVKQPCVIVTAATVKITFNPNCETESNETTTLVALDEWHPMQWVTECSSQMI